MIFNVMHRNGSTIAFDIEKIVAAVEKAWQSSSHNEFYTQEEHQNYHRYVRILAELEWPAYINGDTAFHTLIIDRYETDGEKGVKEEIYRYYGALYLKDLEEQLSASSVINRERLPLFHEALLLYQLGYYYGSVAILTPQIVGITAYIEKHLKMNNTSYDPETLRLIKKRYGFDHTNDTSRVMTAVLEGKSLDDDQNEYGFLLGYLRFKTFHTHIPEKEMERHVNRNMLCHGAQLNYGTKEHALKTILCIDALAWVAEIIAKSITTQEADIIEGQ